MEGAVALLVIFLIDAGLTGVCLARYKGVMREIDDLKSVVSALGTIQRDEPKQALPDSDLIAAVRAALAKDE